MKKTYKGRLFFRTTPQHKYHKNDDILVFEDVYSFDKDHSIDYIKECIKDDLVGVAAYDGEIKVLKVEVL